MRVVDCFIRGIKCDNPQCDFKDHTVRIEDYKQWLNWPCPKCGANLLTQADYDATIALVVGLERRKCRIPFFLRPFVKLQYFRGVFNGTGQVFFEEKGQEEQNGD